MSNEIETKGQDALAPAIGRALYAIARRPIQSPNLQTEISANADGITTLPSPMRGKELCSL